MIPYIRDLIGVPYKVHGRDKKGLDCYGLVIEVFARAEIKLPDAFYAGTSASENMENYPIIKNLVEEGLNLVPVEAPKEMCIVCMAMTGKGVSHIGVYIGEGMILHCVQNFGVCVEPLTKFQHVIKGYYTVGNR